MTIRPAQPADAPTVNDLVQRAYAHYVERIGGRPGPMDEDYAEKIARGLVSVAEEADEIVGLIVLAKESDHLLVENVAVAPEHQGKGVGRALLGFAEDVAREAGTPTLRLYTHALMTENQALYSQLGYEETHRRTDSGFERVFFRKRLGPDHGVSADGWRDQMGSAPSPDEGFAPEVEAARESIDPPRGAWSS